MTRRGASPTQQRAAFIQAGQREIARGMRPLYRIRKGDGADWIVDGATWLILDAPTGARALVAARVELAGLLEVEPDRFDVELDDADVTTLTPPKRDGQVYGG